MKLIVGLGNPGSEYENTRHNVGFMVLDKLLEDVSPLKKTFWEQSIAESSVGRKEKSTKVLTKKVNIEGHESYLAKPQTYMNESGLAVLYLSQRFSINPRDIYVVYDDLDLPFGKLRIRFGGAAGGHKGVESIIQNLQTDEFLRIRLGIGRPTKLISKIKYQKSKTNIEEYILAQFDKHEKGKVRTMIKEGIRMIKLLLKEGIDMYMGKYNKR